MRELLIIVLGISTLLSHAQVDSTTTHRDEFKFQVDRTPFIIWDWADQDSVSGYQDTIPGVIRLFHRYLYDDYTDYVFTYYDLESVYDGSTTEHMIEEWLSYRLDSTYHHRALAEFNEYTNDTLRVIRDRKYFGSAWNEPYFSDGKYVVFENLSLDLDTVAGEPYFVMFYMRVSQDSVELK